LLNQRLKSFYSTYQQVNNNQVALLFDKVEKYAIQRQCFIS
jgi:hypothetical protein